MIGAGVPAGTSSSERLLDARGIIAVGPTPEEFERMVRSDTQEVAKLVEAACVTID